jgi:hypothetical protein
MVTREVVKKIWSDAGLYRDADPRLRGLLNYFDEHPDVCWETILPLFREEYYDLYDVVVPPLVNSSDTMLRLQLISRIDPARPKELGTLQDIVAHADASFQRPELKAILALKHPGLKDQITRLLLQAAPAAPTERARRPVTNVLHPPVRPQESEAPVQIAAPAEAATDQQQQNAVPALNAARLEYQTGRPRRIRVGVPPSAPTPRPVTNVLRPPARPADGEHP